MNGLSVIIVQPKIFFRFQKGLNESLFHQIPISVKGPLGRSSAFKFFPQFITSVTIDQFSWQNYWHLIMDTPMCQIDTFMD